MNVQTIFWMDAFLYLMLHAAIWYGLARFRSPVVLLWSVSGIFSALGLCVLGSRGLISLDLVVVVGQFLMAAGNWGRQVALRSLNGPADRSWLWASGGANLAFLTLSYSLHFTGSPESTIMLLFYAYYTFNCLEYFVTGQRIGLTHDPKGAASVKWAGLLLSLTLGIKTLAMLTGVGATDLYENAWDHAVVFVGQFVGLVMLCIGFMQIFIEQDHRKKMAIEQQLAREQERAVLALKHSEDLSALLTEREEIIRQLTLSNKSAGMGALVASFAHELNQPLTANLLHAELMQARLAAAQNERQPLDLVMLSSVADELVKDAQRAGDIIRKLRNLFRMSKGDYAHVPLTPLVLDMVDLVRAKMDPKHMALSTELDQGLQLHGDATQLQQVVLNLLNNAIEAMLEMPEGQARLTVRGQVSGDCIDIDVEDNGKGIAPEHRGDLFSLFKTSKAQGMGVGLWLSQAIAQAHGGQLTCHCEPGLRTVFTLRLPLSQN